MTVQSRAMTTLPGPLVNADWLAEHLDAPDLRVLEATVYLTPHGREAYDDPLRPRRLGGRPHPRQRVRRCHRRPRRAAPDAELHVPVARALRRRDVGARRRGRDGGRDLRPQRDDVVDARVVAAARLRLRAPPCSTAAGRVDRRARPTRPRPQHDATFTPRPRPRAIADRAEVADRPALPAQRARAGRLPRRRGSPGSTNLARATCSTRTGRFARPTSCASGSGLRRARRRARRRVLRRGHLRDARRVRADPARGAGCGGLRRLDVRVDGGSRAARWTAAESERRTLRRESAVAGSSGDRSGASPRTALHRLTADLGRTPSFKRPGPPYSFPLATEHGRGRNEGTDTIDHGAGRRPGDRPALSPGVGAGTPEPAGCNVQPAAPATSARTTSARPQRRHDQVHARRSTTSARSPATCRTSRVKLQFPGPTARPSRRCSDVVTNAQPDCSRSSERRRSGRSRTP